MRRRRKLPELSACGRFCASADWSWKCGRGVCGWMVNCTHRVYRVAMTTFYCTFHHVEKSDQPGEGGWVQAHAPPFTMYIYHHVQSRGVRSS
jgi:hypothetical protein